jgi:hypothetical protein
VTGNFGRCRSVTAQLAGPVYAIFGGVPRPVTQMSSLLSLENSLILDDFATADVLVLSSCCVVGIAGCGRAG